METRSLFLLLRAMALLSSNQADRSLFLLLRAMGRLQFVDGVRRLRQRPIVLWLLLVG